MFVLFLGLGLHVDSGAAATAEKDPTLTVHSIRGDFYRLSRRDGKVPVEAGETFHGIIKLRTGFYSSAHLELAPGVRIYMGPLTTISLAKRNAPVLLEEGELVIENRTGQRGAAEARIAVALGEVVMASDSRLWLWSTSPLSRLPSLVKALTDKGDVHFALPEGMKTPLDPNVWLYAASWLPTQRWLRRPADEGESERIRKRLFTLRDRSQKGDLPVSLPLESLKINQYTPDSGNEIILTRADMEHGYIVLSGYFLPDRLIPTGEELQLKVTRDGGRHWERVYMDDPLGHFLYSFTPIDGTRFELGVGVFEEHTGRAIETTPIYPVLYVEALDVVLEDVTLCGQPIPSSASKIEFYSDELVDSSLVLEGRLTVNAPLDRIKLRASGDNGHFWKDATIEKEREKTGVFRVSFPPVPKADYRFRVRAEYRNFMEETRPYQSLGSWDAPVLVHYNDHPSVDRVRVIMDDLAESLALGKSRRILSRTSSRFKQIGRDLVRAAGTRLSDIHIERSGETIHAYFSWVRQTRNSVTGGEGLMIFVKEGDWSLLEITGDDPLRSTPPLLLRRPRPGGGFGRSRLVTQVLVDGQTLDFESGQSSPTDDNRIPDDLSCELNFDGDVPVLILTTHDRRLATLGPMHLEDMVSANIPPRLTFRNIVFPEPGVAYLVLTREGGRVLFEVKRLDRGDEDDGVTIAYAVLPEAPR